MSAATMEGTLRYSCPNCGREAQASRDALEYVKASKGIRSDRAAVSEIRFCDACTKVPA